MKPVLINNTDIHVSPAGLGTVKFGRNQKINYPSSFDLPSDKEIIMLLSYAKDLGINLLDTAPAYGSSEERLGQLLKNQRQDWVICSKAGEEFINGESSYDFTPAAIRSSVERSLKRLHTDYIDILMIHSNGDDEKIILEYGALETLNDLKKAGLIRATGMSTKTVAGGLLAVEQSDVVMATYNPTLTTEQPVLAHAHKNNKAIFIKKAFASGHLPTISSAEDPIQAALNFICKEPGVTSIIFGTLNQEHLAHNIKCLHHSLLERG
jgi:aryl-alcohol dehydrogenase-like predicted oxidoreductase